MLLALLLAVADELPPIVLPTVQPEVREVVPQPAPPAPRVVTEISAGVFFVIESAEPLLVLSSPAGVVDAVYESGRIKCRGRFAEDPERTQTRELVGPHLCFVEALQPGTVELLIVRGSALDAAEVLRHTLTVTGEGPRPPPPDIDPDPEPEPEPEPEPDGVVPVPNPDELRVLFVVDQDAPQRLLSELGGVPFRNWHDDNCKGWRRWDRSGIDDGRLDDADPTFRKIWEDVGEQVPDGPHVLITSGTTVQIVPLVAGEVLEALKKARGQE